MLQSFLSFNSYNYFCKYFQFDLCTCSPFQMQEGDTTQRPCHRAVKNGRRNHIHKKESITFSTGQLEKPSLDVAPIIWEFSIQICFSPTLPQLVFSSFTRSPSAEKGTFPSRTLNFWLMTISYKFHLDGVKVNPRSEMEPGLRVSDFSSLCHADTYVKCHFVQKLPPEQTDTHNRPTVLQPGAQTGR